ncbi:hypothetical protein BJY00DRAFT_314691 [Aspergillus carlsbadensis]|nr:hypothetical protein BJY00DRAFT_314691 [Aspergillus carlsbadensis]
MTLIANPLYMPSEVANASVASLPRLATVLGYTPGPARSRRSHGSSSDENPLPTADGFVQYDLRAGGPTICESPCKTITIVPEDHPHHDELTGVAGYDLLSRLRQVSRHAGLDVVDITFAIRQAILDPIAQSTVTLIVLAKRNTGRVSWPDAARSLYLHLRGQNIHRVPVEITDPSFDCEPFVHPCLTTDAVFPVWEPLAEQILDTVGLSGVHTLGCYRIGDNSNVNMCPPTALMGIDRKSTRDWKLVREGIVTILDSNGLGSVAVIIRKDISPLASGQELDTSASVEEWNGTLGAWVEVKLPGTEKYVPFAITCSHCCFPPEEGLDRAELTDILKWNPEGVKVGDMKAKEKLIMNSPNPSAIQGGIENLIAEETGSKMQQPTRWWRS